MYFAKHFVLHSHTFMNDSRTFINSSQTFTIGTCIHIANYCAWVHELFICLQTCFCSSRALYVDFKFVIYILYCWCKDLHMLTNLGLCRKCIQYAKLTSQTFMHCSRMFMNHSQMFASILCIFTEFFAK